MEQNSRFDLGSAPQQPTQKKKIIKASEIWIVGTRPIELILFNL